MSSPLFKDDVLSEQRLLAAAGLYHGVLDGDWGPQTSAAQDAWEAFYTSTAKALGIFDPRTESVILTLLPKAQVAARKFMNAAMKLPFTVKLISGERSYAEQDRLFAQRPKVTNARGGQSNHNFAIAWDAGIFIGGQYDEGRNAKENQPYLDLAKVAKAAVPGLEWGGDWSSFKDLPHYQLATGKTVAQCRALLEAGRAYV
jgi:peptidoglycan L-alanyl-D-glutamate endopeptidase CwlK